MHLDLAYGLNMRSMARSTETAVAAALWEGDVLSKGSVVNTHLTICISVNGLYRYPSFNKYVIYKCLL
jgi:hypothetical protein